MLKSRKIKPETLLDFGIIFLYVLYMFISPNPEIWYLSHGFGMFLQISAKPFRTPKPKKTELEIACKPIQIRFQDHLKNIPNFGMLFGADIKPKTIKKGIPSIAVSLWFGTLDPRKGPKGHPDLNFIEKKTSIGTQQSWNIVEFGDTNGHQTIIFKTSET